MTGFGSIERDGFRVEVRSLNHRFLDISIKMPPQLLRHETALRDMVKERFQRGRFDIFISASATGNVRLRPNIGHAKELLASLNSLREELGIKGEIDIETLLSFKELLITEETEYEAGSLFGAFGEALGEVEAMRLKEGGSINGVILKGAEKIEALNSEVLSLCPSAREKALERFKEKVRPYLSGAAGAAGADEARLMYEASRAAEKADITEELERIKSHLDYLRQTLKAGVKIGKTLDFILQELYRETNTIASKSEEKGITEKTIEMKSEIEAMRELIQNIQ